MYISQHFKMFKLKIVINFWILFEQTFTYVFYLADP